MDKQFVTLDGPYYPHVVALLDLDFQVACANVSGPTVTWDMIVWKEFESCYEK
jgi:hypothetical protein